MNKKNQSFLTFFFSCRLEFSCCPRSWMRRSPSAIWAPLTSSWPSCPATSPSTWVFLWRVHSSLIITDIKYINRPLYICLLESEISSYTYPDIGIPNNLKFSPDISILSWSHKQVYQNIWSQKINIKHHKKG